MTVLVSFALLLFGQTAGQEGQETPSDRGKILGMDSFGGSKSARAMLLDQRFVVTDETYRQICSFYIQRKPAFVTTDAVLYGYYANVEKAVRELERLQAPKLTEAIKGAAKGFAAFRKERLDPLIEKGTLGDDWVKAREGIESYLAVARALSTGKTTKSDLEQLSPVVAREIRMTLAAAERGNSPLRGIPVDYPRFSPRGFYAGDAILERYYRAMTWLYEVPFRAKDEAESRQALLLVKATRYFPDSYSFYYITRPYQQLLGTSDDLDLDRYNMAFSSAVTSLSELDKKPEVWAKAWKAMKALPKPKYTTVPSAEAVIDPAEYGGLRLIARPVQLENEVFTRLSPPGLRRPPPSGEEFLAALGNPVANEIVRNREGREIGDYESLVKKAKEAVTEKKFESPFLAARYALYSTLSKTPTDESLPAWYRHPNWRAKDLNTALAGWAHHRYIWDLHAKRNAMYGGLIDVPPGLVEPNLPFFEALLELTIWTDVLFRDAGVKKARFHNLSALLLELRGILKSQLAGRPLKKRQKDVLERFGPWLAYICGFDGNSWLSDQSLPDTTFSVPVSEDLASGRIRTVGQGRPRAIYVLAETGGNKYLAVGGVLSYRDHVGPVSGPAAMTEERWKASVPIPPAWQERFSVSHTEEELLALLEKGELIGAMFRRATPKMGEILARKLAAGHSFRMKGSYDPDDDAVRLYVGTGDPGVVATLFPLVLKPNLDSSYPIHFRQWGVTKALEGKLGKGHFDRLMKRLEEPHPVPHVVIGLAATIKEEGVEESVLAFLDKTHASPNRNWHRVVEQAATELLRRPGMRMSRELLKRIDRYSEKSAWRVGYALSERWKTSYIVKEDGLLVIKERRFSSEEREFRKALSAKLEELDLELD